MIYCLDGFQIEDITASKQMNHNYVKIIQFKKQKEEK